MSKKEKNMLKKIFRILIIIITILAILLLMIVVIRDAIDKYINKKLVTETYQTIAEVNTEENIEQGLVSPTKYNDNNILGIIKIDDIGFEGAVYQGTTVDTLKIGVGHFEDTPIFDGNVCFAAHNTNKFWARLKNLKEGSKIIYTSYFGKREYEVFSIKQIEETDITLLENTEENIVTLITCIKGQKDKRLCVQAREI